MNNSEFYWTVAGGMIFGWLLAGLVVTMVPSSKIGLYDTAIELCEKSLPRDKSCKIVAVAE